MTEASGTPTVSLFRVVSGRELEDIRDGHGLRLVAGGRESKMFWLTLDNALTFSRRLRLIDDSPLFVIEFVAPQALVDTM